MVNHVSVSAGTIGIFAANDILLADNLMVLATPVIDLLAFIHEF